MNLGELKAAINALPDELNQAPVFSWRWDNREQSWKREEVRKVTCITQQHQVKLWAE